MERLNDIFTGNIPRRETETGLYSEIEVGLANRNHGLLLETMAADTTPVGAHYLLNHFDIPILGAERHRLSFTGAFANPFELSLGDINTLPQSTMPVVLECAGNGRRGMEPRSHSMPWGVEAAGCAEWTGTPLWPLIEKAAPTADVVEVSFTGADEGYDDGIRHHYGRALTLDELRQLDVLLVTRMNGVPLLPQHGAPLRIIVPGWYGMASVKWLTEIRALTKPYEGFQQIETYRFRQTPDEPGDPVSTMRVKSLMIPPGVPDWQTRVRLLRPGKVTVMGRAWSGNGVPIQSVALGVSGEWTEAEVSPAAGPYAWSRWQCEWLAAPGEHTLECRATDAKGSTQPQIPEWNLSGFANNATHKVRVLVAE